MGGQLAAGDGHQAIAADLDHVPSPRRGRVALDHRKRAQPGGLEADAIAPQHAGFEEARRLVEDGADVGLGDLHPCGIARIGRVGGAEHEHALPGDAERDSPSPQRHRDAGAPPFLQRKQEVDALAQAHQRFRVGVVEGAHVVDPGTRGVDDVARAQLERSIPPGVDGDRATAVVTQLEADDLRMVEDQGARFRGRLHRRQHEARVDGLGLIEGAAHAQAVEPETWDGVVDRAASEPRDAPAAPGQRPVHQQSGRHRGRSAR